MKLFFVVLVLFLLWSVWGYLGSRVEQAEYIVLKKERDYEVREYKAHIVAETTVEGSYDESLNKGFSIIAGYIFGGNTAQKSIAMTAPVVTKSAPSAASEKIAMTAPVIATANGSSQIISFGMPASYTLNTLPIPNDARVVLKEIPSRKMAVVRFSFFRTEKRVVYKQKQLLAALARDGVETIGNVAYAGYNAPWTPPWMNRNEVMIEIK